MAQQSGCHRLAKALQGAKPSDHYQQRRLQYAVLFELQKIKHEGVDDSQYIHALSYVELTSEQFREIDTAEFRQLNIICRALSRIVDQRAVPQYIMRAALAAEHYQQYMESFNYDISHVEADIDDDIPAQLEDYLAAIRKGDRYTRLANLFSRTQKRDVHGKTTRQRYETKAEGCYEEAVMDLVSVMELDPQRNPFPDAYLAARIQEYLDRDVDTRDGYAPDNSQVGVPRLRGSKSKFTLMETHTVVGVRLRKHWRQREALSKAALELLYLELEEDIATEQQLELLRTKLANLRNAHSTVKLHPEKD